MARSRSLPKFGPYGMRRKGRFEESKHRRVKGRFADKPDVVDADIRPTGRMRLGRGLMHVSMDNPGVQRRRAEVAGQVTPEEYEALLDVEAALARAAGVADAMETGSANPLAAMKQPVPQKRTAEIRVERPEDRAEWKRIFGDMQPQTYAERIAQDLPEGVTVSVVARRVMDVSSDGWESPALDVQMTFERHGAFIADAQRSFSRGTELHVKHVSFHVDRGEQRKGLAKRFLRNSMAVYKDIGVSRIATDANIDVGGYAWAKYGFRYGAANERNFRLDAYENLDKVQGQLDAETRERAKALIGKVDQPGKIWALADLRQPVVMDKGRSTERRTTLGKAILMHTEWPASLRLDDAEAMARFDAYVNKGGEGGEQAQDTVDRLPAWSLDREGRSIGAQRILAVVTSEARPSDRDFLAFAEKYATQNRLTRDMAVRRLFPGWQVSTEAQRQHAKRTGWYD